MFQSKTTGLDSKPAEARPNHAPVGSGAPLRLPPVAPLGNQAVLRLQRKCDRGGSPDCDCDSKNEKKPKGHLHRSALSSASPRVAPPIVQQVLQSPGQALDPGTQAFFESRFGHSFSSVRIHTDARAAQSARTVNAMAYTVGRDIAFAQERFSPATVEGRKLLAHELTHVVQQHGASASGPVRISKPGDAAEVEAASMEQAITPASAPTPTTIDRGERLPAVREHHPAIIARAPFSVDAITQDADNMADHPVQIGSATRPMSALFIKYHFSPAFGDLTFAADYPSTLKMPAKKTQAIPSVPKADAVPPLSNIPVVGFFFPATWPTTRRALVLGGFHGDEHPGWEMVEALVKEMQAGNFSPAFHTIVVPRVNAGGIADELGNVHLWHNRCNRQAVDLNRNFPVPGQTAKATDCPNTPGAPIQPETKAVMDLVTKFKPDRILSAHDIDTIKQAGVYADPNQDADAKKLARGMASTIVNSSDREGNKLGPSSFNPVYPGDKPGVVGAGTSLGAWGPTAIAGRTTPVITIEAPGDAPLSTGPGTQSRTVEGFLRPIHAFLGEPNQLDTQADRDILGDIDALNASDRVSFLTGRAPLADAITERIRQRVLTAVANLQAMGPPKPLTAESHVRLADKSIPNAKGGTAQAEIDFDKFFLTGSRTNGWDTLPAQFWQNGQVGTKPDRNKWLNTSSKDRLTEILKFSSLPGASRHHWATEVDFNSTNVDDWLPGKIFGALGTWLDTNAPKTGLIRAYTPGRSGGYNNEPWHFSYAPISVGLRDRYNQQANLQTDVVDKMVADFKQRAAATGLNLPPDFASAVAAVNISDLVNKVGPGL